MNPTLTAGQTILFVDHTSALGGAEHLLLMMLELMDSERWEVHLACPAGPLSEMARAQGASVHELTLPRLRRSARFPSDWFAGGADANQPGEGCSSRHFGRQHRPGNAVHCAGRPAGWCPPGMVSPRFLARRISTPLAMGRQAGQTRSMQHNRGGHRCFVCHRATPPMFKQNHRGAQWHQYQAVGTSGCQCGLPCQVRHLH